MPRAGRRRRPSIKRQQYLYPILEQPSFNTPFPIPYPPFPTPLLLPPPFHALPLPTPVAKWGQIYYAGAASLPVNYTCPEARAPSSLRAPQALLPRPPGRLNGPPGVSEVQARLGRSVYGGGSETRADLEEIAERFPGQRFLHVVQFADTLE